MFADYTYRLGPRRMIHELFFDMNFSGFFTEAKTVLAQNHDTCIVKKEEEIVQSKSNETLNYIIHVANEQRKAELSNTAKNKMSNSRNVIKGVLIGDISGDNSADKLSLSPTRYELRSPPLSSVQEELASNENLLANDETQIKTEVVSTIKTLDSLKLSYKENKFPIKERGDSRNSTK